MVAICFGAPTMSYVRKSHLPKDWTNPMTETHVAPLLAHSNAVVINLEAAKEGDVLVVRLDTRVGACRENLVHLRIEQEPVPHLALIEELASPSMLRAARQAAGVTLSDYKPIHAMKIFGTEDISCLTPLELQAKMTSYVIAHSRVMAGFDEGSRRYIDINIGTSLVIFFPTPSWDGELRWNTDDNNWDSGDRVITSIEASSLEAQLLRAALELPY